jgi:hypothetical protein
MSIPSLISEADYCAIEDALQSSEKGRRFLRVYADRNRGLESRRLLRSISRLHRATLGTPGLNAEAYRDLVSMLRGVARHKQAASQCCDVNTRFAILTASLEEVEACLITLAEAIEERVFNSLGGGMPGSELDAAHEIAGSGHPTGLFDEHSPHFMSRPR